MFNIGSLGAENALSLHLPNKQELELKYGSLLKRYFVVVFHPETLSTQSVNDQIDELLSAISFLKILTTLFLLAVTLTLVLI